MSRVTHTYVIVPVSRGRLRLSRGRLRSLAPAQGDTRMYRTSAAVAHPTLAVLRYFNSTTDDLFQEP